MKRNKVQTDKVVVMKLKRLNGCETINNKSCYCSFSPKHNYSDLTHTFICLDFSAAFQVTKTSEGQILL